MDSSSPQPQQQAPQPISQQEVIQEKSQHTLQKVLGIVLGIIIVLVLVGGAYYLGFKKGAVGNTNKNLIVKPTVSNSNFKNVQMVISPTPISSKKLFINNDLGGSFLYPSDWQQNKINPPSKTVDISFTKSVCQKDKCLNYYVTIESYPTSINTAQAFVNQYYPGSTSSTVVSTTDYIASNGLDYKKALDQYNTFPDYFIIQNGKVYIISTSISGELKDTTSDQTQAFIDSVEELLNSFTFKALPSDLEQLTTWNVYESNKYKISYPSSWSASSQSDPPDSLILSSPDLKVEGAGISKGFSIEFDYAWRRWSQPNIGEVRSLTHMTWLGEPATLILGATEANHLFLITKHNGVDYQITMWGSSLDDLNANKDIFLEIAQSIVIKQWEPSPTIN